MKKIMTMAAAGALVLAACGSDDDGGGDGGNSSDALVAALVGAFEGDEELEGVELDEDCLKDIADGLSEEDRAILVEAIETDEDPVGLSPEGDAASVEILECIDIDLGALLEEE